MNDNDLIGYCDIHCETPRALFNGKQINRMLELAGETQRVPPDTWLSLHEDMKVLVKRARARARARQTPRLKLV